MGGIADACVAYLASLGGLHAIRIRQNGMGFTDTRLLRVYRAATAKAGGST